MTIKENQEELTLDLDLNFDSFGEDDLPVAENWNKSSNEPENLKEDTSKENHIETDENDELNDLSLEDIIEEDSKPVKETKKVIKKGEKNKKTNETQENDGQEIQNVNETTPLLEEEELKEIKSLNFDVDKSDIDEINEENNIEKQNAVDLTDIEMPVITETPKQISEIENNNESIVDDEITQVNLDESDFKDIHWENEYIPQEITNENQNNEEEQDDLQEWIEPLTIEDVQWTIEKNMEENKVDEENDSEINQWENLHNDINIWNDEEINEIIKPRDMSKEEQVESDENKEYDNKEENREIENTETLQQTLEQKDEEPQESIFQKEEIVEDNQIIEEKNEQHIEEKIEDLNIWDSEIKEKNQDNQTNDVQSPQNILNEDVKKDVQEEATQEIIAKEDPQQKVETSTKTSFFPQNNEDDPTKDIEIDEVANFNDVQIENRSIKIDDMEEFDLTELQGMAQKSVVDENETKKMLAKQKSKWRWIVIILILLALWVAGFFYKDHILAFITWWPQTQEPEQTQTTSWENTSNENEIEENKSKTSNEERVQLLNLQREQMTKAFPFYKVVSSWNTPYAVFVQNHSSENALLKFNKIFDEQVKDSYAFLFQFKVQELTPEALIKHINNSLKSEWDKTALLMVAKIYWKLNGKTKQVEKQLKNETSTKKLKNTIVKQLKTNKPFLDSVNKELKAVADAANFRLALFAFEGKVMDLRQTVVASKQSIKESILNKWDFAYFDRWMSLPESKNYSIEQEQKLTDLLLKALISSDLLKPVLKKSNEKIQADIESSTAIRDGMDLVYKLDFYNQYLLNILSKKKK